MLSCSGLHSWSQLKESNLEKGPERCTSHLHRDGRTDWHSFSAYAATHYKKLWFIWVGEMPPWPSLSFLWKHPKNLRKWKHKFIYSDLYKIVKFKGKMTQPPPDWHLFIYTQVCVCHIRIVTFRMSVRGPGQSNRQAVGSEGVEVSPQKRGSLRAAITSDGCILLNVDP